VQTPLNTFKQALAARTPQIGLWFGLASGYAAELVAGAGFDWLLLDGEHAPNDVPRMLEQLQGVASARAMLGTGPHPVARVPVGDTALIKQYLDIGAQTLLVPMVDTPEQAAQLVRAMRYPGYLQEANSQVCLLVQAESTLAIENLDAIARTPGVDGVFFGPADLSASMGHVGNPGHPAVQAAIEDGIRRVLAAGKAPGILMADEKLARRYLELGAVFVAVGVDTSVLVAATRDLAARYGRVLHMAAAAASAPVQMAAAAASAPAGARSTVDVGALPPTGGAAGASPPGRRVRGRARPGYRRWMARPACPGCRPR
jgi:4-hydroxy-2-oxoheptanedioate aldolase